MRQLANRLAKICTAANSLATAGKSGHFRDLEEDLTTAMMEVLEAGEAHLAMKKYTYEFAQNELSRQPGSPSARNIQDDVIECFEDAIEALHSARWAILIADGVDALPGNRAFTNGKELVEATLAE